MILAYCNKLDADQADALRSLRFTLQCAVPGDARGAALSKRILHCYWDALISGPCTIDTAPWRSFFSAVQQLLAYLRVPNGLDVARTAQNEAISQLWRLVDENRDLVVEVSTAHSA
ncbi:MAG: hypothetical protein ACXVAM_19290 [Vulcanimicrobiaceae bacterium]